MMSPKRWILLLVFYISYLMFGASIYYHIEHNLEKEKRTEELQERIDIHEYLLKQLNNHNITVKEEVLERISDYCGRPVTDYRNDEYEIPFTWTFYHSFFFAFTVCSTVGYGNISPTTTLGRMIVIIYSVIGIPINSILFAGLGEYFARIFRAIYRRYKRYKMSTNIHYVPPQLSLITTLLIALVPGITMFLLIPSWVFSYFEDWPFSLAFYYAYITTTTIGFGDYVPTFQPQQHREFGIWFIVYQIFIIIWFIFSLGYLLMIMTFITRGLQSKKLLYLEQQLSANIKATQNRIWGGVLKDVTYMRKIFNELYIMKFKPVYTKPNAISCLHRSISCPELTMYREENTQMLNRKRAFSECHTAIAARGVTTPIQASSSDTELNKIDRQKSFETAEAFRQTTSLLVKVVNTLATMQHSQNEETDMGYHGFSDSQILSTEWPFAGLNQMDARRERASSDFNIASKWPKNLQNNASGLNEWTWSGDNDHIQEVINQRYRGQNNAIIPMFRGASDDVNFREQTWNSIGEEELKRKARNKKFSIPDGFRKLFPFRRLTSQVDVNNLERNAGQKTDRKLSVVSVPDAIKHEAPSLDYYSTVTANASPTYFSNGKLNSFKQPNVPQRLRLQSKSNILARQASKSDILTSLDSNSEQSTVTRTNMGYLKNITNVSNRRHRELASSRRPSAFTTAISLNANTNSLLNAYRRGSSTAQSSMRRSSIFTCSADMEYNQKSRRLSMFSNNSNTSNSMDILENTTLGDLIRVLEAVHTQAVLSEAREGGLECNSSSANALERRKQRRIGNAGLELPPILPLFSKENDRTLTTKAINRLYRPRATLPTLQFPSITSNSTINMSQRRRQSNLTDILEPTSSPYQTDDNLSSCNNPTGQFNRMKGRNSITNVSKTFKRRFSIRPTALQIPPGTAPPAPPPPPQPQSSYSSPPSPTILGSNLSNETQTPALTGLPQRYVPPPVSPLAQPSVSTIITTDNISDSNTTRILPLPIRATSITSSTHSPLSRIAQLTQAQRKSSIPGNLISKKSDKFSSLL